MTIRSQRVAEEIRKVVSEYLIKDMRSSLPAMVTISSVSINRDLTVAKVFYSVFGEEEAVRAAQVILDDEKSNIRRLVGKQVRLRLVPELIFVLDDSPVKAARISQLLEDAKTSKSN